METSISGLPEIENQLSQIREEFRELRKGLDQNDAEIDTLQLEAGKAHRPWFRDVSVMISISAVLFSILTTALSYYIATQQEIHNSKVELRGLIQRINALNREYADLLNETGSANQTYHSTAISEELRLLTDQAGSVIDNIPNHITSLEYTIVADSFARIGFPERAEEMYLKAIGTSETRQQKVNSLRSYAGFLSQNQRQEEVRKAYEGALSINKEFESSFPLVVMRDDMWTHVSWAGFELAQRQCTSAREQLNKASEIQANLLLPANDPQVIQLNLLLKSAESCKDS